jgi:hypothetical protein
MLSTLCQDANIETTVLQQSYPDFKDSIAAWLRIRNRAQPSSAVTFLGKSLARSRIQLLHARIGLFCARIPI